MAIVAGRSVFDRNALDKPKSSCYNTNINNDNPQQNGDTMSILLFLMACLFKPQAETPVQTPNVEIVYDEIEINGVLAY